MSSPGKSRKSTAEREWFSILFLVMCTCAFLLLYLVLDGGLVFTSYIVLNIPLMTASFVITRWERVTHWKSLAILLPLMTVPLSFMFAPLLWAFLQWWMCAPPVLSWAWLKSAWHALGNWR
jgi:hypothetical protein